MTTTTSTKKGPLPVAEVALGALRIAIWGNDTKNGVRYSGTVNRTYRDDNGEWQRSGSFDRDAFALLAVAAQEAVRKLDDLQRDARRESHSSNGDEDTTFETEVAK